MIEEDIAFTCPHCWQRVTMRVDTSAGSSDFVQDCEACCNPLEVSVVVRDYRVVEFDVHGIDQ